MVFRKKKWYSPKVRNEYRERVKKYMEANALNIVNEIYSGALQGGYLTYFNVSSLMGEGYPLAPWVDRLDIVAQFAAMLEEIGYVFVQDSYGRYHFKDKELYNAIVKNHLNFTGKKIVTNMAKFCEQNNGRLTYEQVRLMLGFNYPKAPYVDKSDTKTCVILFLKEIGIPFIYDDEYIYIP